MVQYGTARDIRNHFIFLFLISASSSRICASALGFVVNPCVRPLLAPAIVLTANLPPCETNVYGIYLPTLNNAEHSIEVISQGA